MLDPSQKFALALMVFIIMLGMGATLTLKDFVNVLKKPHGVFIGFLSQFGWMPFVAFGLAIALELPSYVAISLILLGATPGGTTSNIFAYYARGDVSLSISMTICSTIAAIFMLPFLLSVYSSELAADIEIPYKNIVGALVMLIIPVVIGMVVKSRSEKLASIVEKTSSVLGIIVVLYLLVVMMINNGEGLIATPIPYFVAAALLGVIGFVLGYGVSALSGLSRRECRTVSLETGIQNTPLTIGIIALSFAASQHEFEMLIIPSLYGLTIVCTSTIATYIFRKYGNNEQETNEYSESKLQDQLQN